ncbi:MAG: hypothetical protein N2Z63_06250 [Thiobacillaceae bacterium]|nr:hypothetical protein [Thiobacillaceae bacterium]
MMQSELPQLRLLYVEDDAADADLTRRALARMVPGIELVVVDSLAQAKAYLQDSPHLMCC